MSAPQLALLEVALSKMERVHAWVLMMGGGGAVNVFEVCPWGCTAASRDSCCNVPGLSSKLSELTPKRTACCSLPAEAAGCRQTQLSSSAHPPLEH